MHAPLIARHGLISLLAGCVVAQLSAQTASFPIRGNFAGQTNVSLTAASWLLSGNTTVTSGHVSLTAAVNAESGAAIYNLPFDSSSGVNVQFDYYMAGERELTAFRSFSWMARSRLPRRDSQEGRSAMPIMARIRARPRPIWESASTGSETGPTARITPAPRAVPGPHFFPNTISIRGPATAAPSSAANGEYIFVAGSNVSYAVEGQKKVNMTIYAGKITLRISSDGGVTWTTIYNALDFGSSVAFNGYTLPATLKIGFGASTGGENDEHDIDDVLITMPVDLSVAFTASPSGTQAVGNSVSYTVTVTNSGPNEDFGATFLYAVPPEITGTSWSYSIGGTGTGTGSGTGNDINTPLDLPSGATATFTISGVLAASAAGQTLAHTATVVPSSSLGDTNPSDNTATASTAVASGPVPSNSYAVSGTYGSAFTYTVTATNTPTGFSASGLPPGLSIDTSTGVISGTPTAAGSYTASIGISNANGSSTTTLAMTIAKAVPSVSWAAPASIVAGTALSGTQLDAGANVPGTWAYIPAPGAVLNAGSNQTLSATFTPTDSTDYAS